MNYAAHYGEYHGTDVEYFERWYRQNNSHLGRLVEGDTQGPILDVGCGFGLLVNALRRLGYENVSGIDVDASQIEVAKGHKLPCEFVSVTEQPSYFAARQNQYNVITLFDVLEHVPVDHQIAFLRMLRGSLKLGGRVVIQTPNASSPIAAHMRFIDHTHTSSFTCDSLRYVVRSAGFGTVDISEAEDEMSAPAGVLQPMRLIRKTAGRAARSLWRIIYLGEFGRPAMQIPLSRNLLAVAKAQAPAGCDAAPVAAGTEALRIVAPSDFIDKRRGGRYNKSYNTILDAWLKILFDARRNTELSVSALGQGSVAENPTFKFGSRTAYARRLLQ